MKNIPLSRSELTDEKRNYLTIHYGDILINYNEILDVDNDKIYYIDKNLIFEKYEKSLIKNGDIIFADAAEDEIVGKCIEVSNISNQKIISGLHTIPCRNKYIFSEKYLGYYFNSQNYHNQLLSLMQGVKVLSISKNSLNNTIVFFPKEYAEQKKIGNYLNSIDICISFFNKKIDVLKKFKQRMLLKMFPRDGEDTPEIRFKHYQQKWNKSKIKDICSISTGKSNTQDNDENGLYPFYVRSPIIEKSNRYLYDEEAVLTVGDGVGTGKVFHYVNGKYDLHQRVYRLFNFTNNVNAKFFYFWFSNNFYKRIMSMTAKTSVDSVRYNMIADMILFYPSIDEQIKIGLFFSRLDNMLNLLNKKIKQLKTLKQSLLSKMFI